MTLGKWTAVPILLILAGCSESADSALARGKKLEAEGKLGEAALAYQKAIQRNASSGEGLYRLGSVQIKQGQIAEAHRNLTTAAPLLPDNEELRVKLAEVSLLAYRSLPKPSQSLYDQLKKSTQEILAKNPNSFDGVRLLGQIALLDRKNEDAVAQFRKANAIQPSQPEVVVPLMELLARSGQYEEAEKLGKDLVTKRPQEDTGWEALYGLYLAAKRPGDADQLVRERAANQPKSLEAGLALARHLARTRNAVELDACLTQMLDRPAEFPTAAMAIGDLYSNLGRRDEARRVYELGAKREPKRRIEYEKRAIAMMIATGDSAGAIARLTALIQSDGTDDDSRHMRAALWLDGRDPALREAALLELAEVVKRKPENGRYWYTLGRGHYGANRLEDASLAFATAITRDPSDFSARAYAAEIALRRGDYAKTIAIADEALGLSPDNPGAQITRAAALLGAKRYGEARGALNRVLQQRPTDPDVLYQFGLLNLAEGKMADAEAYFRKARDTGKSDSRATLGLMEVQAAQGRWAGAELLAREALRVDPKSPTLHLALATIHQRSGNHAAATAELRELALENPASPTDQIRLGEWLLSIGDAAGAMGSFEKARQLAPKDPTPIALISSAQSALGKKSEAIASLRAALALGPNRTELQNNLAFLLAESGQNLEEAFQLAKKAQAQEPSNASFQDTLGWVYLKQGNADMALQVFRALVRKYPQVADFHYHLGLALQAKGDTKEARKSMDAALSAKPDKSREEQIRRAIEAL